MSKKRLYEIAKEVGVESKVVVAKAQELGLSVKSHSSSVEEADANRITSSLKGGTAKAESKPAPKATPTPKEEKVAPKVDKVPVAKSAPAKETSKAEVKEAPATPKKPQSRNFKAEREARAKAEAERRQNGGGRDNRNRNRNQQGNDQGKRQNNDRRNQNGNGQGNRNNGNRGNNSNRDRNFQGKQRNDQGRNKRNDAARNNQAGPRIDFKARAAALKAEQNAEYSRQSETRFREEKAAEQRRAKEQEKARKEKQQAEVAAQKAVAEAKPAPKPAPVAQPAPAAQAQDTRRKKARPDKSRDNRRENEDGPKQTRNNKWNNQNQVRNQRNSNWNKNKNKKGKNNRGNSAPKPVTERKFHELPKEFEYTEGMTVAEIAKRIKREPAEIVKKLFMMGVMATQNQSLDGDTIELLMVDYGIEATKKEEVDNADIERFFVDEDYLNKDAMVERAPVVTIMGHVDHGKTTLLDTLRNSRVATGEAGGITQHIGAYQIEEGGKKITFLDTPGHAAFTSMRARGASVTDITILIVAADDGVMPQTIEAINHSKAAGVPIIVAINKIDKPGANPERVIGELAEHGVISTAWGGDSEFVEISAKFGQNIEELLETVLLVAEVEELKADPTVRAIGTVIEARLDKGKGAVATLLVQQGTLHVQDPIVVGNTFGRVRAMTNDLGRRIKTAAPSTPVSITGLNEAPMAGDHFAVYEDEKAARAAGEERAKRALMKQRQQTHRVSLDNLFDTLKAGELKTVNVIIKADVQGSVEALAASLLKIDVEG
ncbi:MAG: translation initiation factor IF-2, partial [Streptococcus salivarius]